MQVRKQSEGFNLAFLDIMSCGLGAVILVFMLVKQHTDDFPIEFEKLKNDIQNLESVKQEALDTLQTIEAQLSQAIAKRSASQQKIAEMQARLLSQATMAEQIAAAKEKLTSAIKDIKVKKPDDVIENEQIYEEDYLLGLKVEGRKIAILLDSSASMSDEKLIDIIKTKSGSRQDKQRAKKWIRAKKIVEWLLVRLPKDSEVVLVSFNETAQTLGGKAWIKANDAQGLSSILYDLNQQIPEGATNLQAGLKAVNAYAPSNLYVITDGLPTKGDSRYSRLNPFSSCRSLIGSAKKISGECRVKLFQQTINESAKSGRQVDVILLPIEGDPDAINQYWKWAAASGGLVISPANNWP